MIFKGIKVHCRSPESLWRRAAVRGAGLIFECMVCACGNFKHQGAPPANRKSPAACRCLRCGILGSDLGFDRIKVPLRQCLARSKGLFAVMVRVENSTLLSTGLIPGVRQSAAPQPLPCICVAVFRCALTCNRSLACVQKHQTTSPLHERSWAVQHSS